MDKNNNNHEIDETQIELLRTELNTQERAEELLDDAYNEIWRISTELGLSNEIATQSIRLYEKFINSNPNHYPSIAELSAGAIYATCRENGIPRTLNKISKMSSLHTWHGYSSEISHNKPSRKDGERSRLRGRAYRHVNRAFRLYCDTLGIDPPRVPVENFVNHYAEELGVGDEVVEIALVTYSKLQGKDASGRANGSIAAGLIDFATNISGSDVTQKSISRVSGLTDVTIRNRRKAIEEQIT